MRSPKRWIAASLSLLLFTATACTQAGPSAPGSSQTASGTSAATSPAPQQKPKELVVGAAGMPATLDPHIDSQNQSHVVYRAIFDGLTRVEGTSLDPKAGLAETWSIVNPTTWRFNLRRGVKFHNGEPFDAKAVEFSINRILDPATKSQNRGRAAKITGVKVIDDYTVEITTATPDPTVPAGLTWWMMVPPKYIQEKGVQEFIKAPVGTGPFKFESAQGDQRITVVANPDYWGGRPALDRLVLRKIPEHATRAAALKAGEIQVAVNLPLDLVPSVRSDTNLTVAAEPVISAMIIQFDLLQPSAPLKDRRVRQALNYAIDKDAIINNLFGGSGRALSGQVVTQEAFGYCPSVQGYPYDPEKAKALLREAGYPNGFSFRMSVPNGQYVNDVETATVVASQLSRIGVTANLQVLERGAWIDIVSNKRKEPRDSYLVAWYSYGDAEYALRWGTTKSGFPYWADSQFDKSVDSAIGTFDQAERKKHYCDAIARYREEAPAIFLLQPPLVMGIHKSVTGFDVRADQIQLFDKVDLK